MKAHSYTHQVHWMLIREHRSVHSTTSNQLCKLPSPMCCVGTTSHAGGQAHLLLASLKKRSNCDDMICNTFFNSLPHEDICSLCWVWTNHHCAGKMIFVCILLVLKHKIPGLSCLYLAELTQSPSYLLREDSLVHFSSVVIVKGISSNLQLNVLLCCICDSTGNQTS